MSDRLERERTFHDRVFADGSRSHLGRFYSVFDASEAHYRSALLERGTGRQVLELGCGPSSHAVPLALTGSRVTGIDISPVAIEKAREDAKKAGVDDRMIFRIANAEQLDFPDGSFDLVCGHAIIHHLNLEKLFGELRRVLRASGEAVFNEPLGHNPLINEYRRRTPRLRTPDEHPLVMSDLRLARDFFEDVSARYFHLTSLASIPLHGRRVQGPVLRGLHSVDRAIFKVIPPMRAWAWYAVIQLSRPRPEPSDGRGGSVGIPD